MSAFAKDINVPINDCISRQAAIDVICKACANGDDFTECRDRELKTSWCDNMVALRDLSSAQPEQRWIPCGERLPEEEDSIFARYYGTDRWRKAMFRKKSREVIVTSVFEDGELHTEVAHTTDGKWCVGVNVVPRTVIAWMPLPEPYEEKDNERA